MFFFPLNKECYFYGNKSAYEYKKHHEKSLNRDSRGLTSVGAVFLIPFHWGYRFLEEN